MDAKTHTTVVHSDSPVRLYIDADDGRYFRLFNAVVDSGAWANLAPAAKSLLLVLARLAQGEARIVRWHTRNLCHLTGLKKTALFEARTQLELHPHGLLRRTPDLNDWALFPGRRFANKNGSRESAQADSVRLGGHLTSPPERTPQSAQADSQSAYADSSKGSGILRLKHSTTSNAAAAGEFEALAKAIQKRPEWCPGWGDNPKPWIDARTARELAALPTTTPEVIAWAFSQTHERRKTLANPAGFFVAMLRRPDLDDAHRLAESRRRAAQQRGGVA